MKFFVVLSLLVALCYGSPLTASSKKTDDTTTDKPNFVSPWFSSITTDAGKQISSPWFASTSADGKTFSTPWFSTTTNPDGTKQIVTPWFSTLPDGSKQITNPFFNAQISSSADPLLPSSFKFQTPFSAQPVGLDGTAAPQGIFEQVFEQANAQQQVDLQQLVQLIGDENTEVLLNALIGHYSEITPVEFQNLQQVIPQVGQANIQKILDSFAGEKFKFPTQYGKESVKLPAMIVFDKILEQLDQQVGLPQGPSPQTQQLVAPYQYPGQQQGPYQYPIQQQGPYQYPIQQQGLYQYPSQQQGSYQYSSQQGIYGRYAPQYYSYNVEPQYGYQVGPQSQYYYPVSQGYQQSQYNPYQQYASGYQQYQPSATQPRIAFVY